MFAYKYIEGSGGSLRMFSRPIGTKVAHQCGVEHGYTSTGREIVVQWEGDVNFDSGYAAHTWTDTPTNRKKAWKYFNEYH